jgi:hypothetical protein
MKYLRQMGFSRVLRGDESFGWQGRVYSYNEANAEVGIRPLDKLNLYSNLLRPKYWQLWCDGSSAAIERLISHIYGMDPNDAKDYLYFTQRLQCYLNSAAYYKQVVTDHRAVLLDDAILDFLTRVRWRLRINKKLFTDTVSTAYRDLWTVPIATTPGREDWALEMARPSQLRTYVDEQLNDANSGIWEYFNRTAMKRVLESLKANATPDAGQEVRLRLRSLAQRTLTSTLPRVASQVRAKRIQSMIPPFQVLFRFLVFKHWHDTVISRYKDPFRVVN